MLRNGLDGRQLNESTSVADKLLVSWHLQRIYGCRARDKNRLKRPVFHGRRGRIPACRKLFYSGGLSPMYRGGTSANGACATAVPFRP